MEYLKRLSARISIGKYHIWYYTLSTHSVFKMLVTARKRSLRRLCFYRCLSFCPWGGGGHAWLLRGGMHGCSGRGRAWLLWGGVHGCLGVCMVAGGACVVAPRGVACVVARGGGMRGCSGACVVALGGHVWLLWGACVVASGGGHALFFAMRYGQ